MCGIFALLDIQGSPDAARELAVRQARLLRHRGPDWSGVYADDRAVLPPDRLAIVHAMPGAQPLRPGAGFLVLAVKRAPSTPPEPRHSSDPLLLPQRCVDRLIGGPPRYTPLYYAAATEGDSRPIIG